MIFWRIRAFPYRDCHFKNSMFFRMSSEEYRYAVYRSAYDILSRTAV